MAQLETFFRFFIPLFVTIDAFGLVPVFLAVTGGMNPAQRRHVSFVAVAVGLLICVGFMFLGNTLFNFLSITTEDFKIAGGIILLVLAVLDLLTSGKPAVHEQEVVGIVPLAMPLIAGPATLTATLILPGRAEFGYAWTMFSLAVNFIILLFVLLSSSKIARLIGSNTLRAFSKLVMVLLAAIAVNYIRSGILDCIRQMKP